jgi:fatty-acyl-CoA synthase
MKAGINLGALAEQVVRLPTTAREAAVVMRSGMMPLTRPDKSARGLLALRRYGILGAAIRIAADRDPGMLGLVDERGELTFGE